MSRNSSKQDQQLSKLQQDSCENMQQNILHQKSVSSMSKENWPPSLKDYVNKCFKKCKTDIDKDQVEIILKGKIVRAYNVGTIFTKDWNAEPVPSTHSDRKEMEEKMSSLRNQQSKYSPPLSASETNFQQHSRLSVADFLQKSEQNNIPVSSKKSCCVYGCKERAFKGSSVTFHSFPREKVRRKQWETKIGTNIVTNSSKVCSKHFTPDCFETQFGSTCLKKTAVPTLFIPKDPETEITHKPLAGKISEELSVSIPEQGSLHPNISNSNGEVTAKLEHCVTWKIPNFFGLPKEDDFFLDSPEFELFGDTWHLRLLPNNEYGCEFDSDDEEEGYYQKFFEIWLMRLVSSGHGQDYYHITMGLVKPCGGEHGIHCWDYRYVWEEGYRTKEFDSEGQKFFGNKFYQEYYLFEDAHYLDDGAVTLYCRLSLPEPCDVTPPPADGKAAPKELSSVDKWLSDFKKLLESGAGSDLLVVVSGREFRAHRGILMARSPVFDAMFQHEKESGKVVIEDLAPDVFQDFLDYMYSGNVEVCSEENVLGLYAAADKYAVQELKSEALQYMQRTLSAGSFCDVMALALRHKETDLVDRAADFFKSHLTKIIVLEKWQAFLRDHNTAANELFIKALVPRDEVE